VGWAVFAGGRSIALHNTLKLCGDPVDLGRIEQLRKDEVAEAIPERCGKARQAAAGQAGRQAPTDLRASSQARSSESQ